MSTIAVIGTGYVGLVTGAWFAELGNYVTCVDIIEEKVRSLRAGEMPFFEPGLAEMVARSAEAGRLRFTTSYTEAVPDADFVFITVDTPPATNGKADMSRVEAASRSIAQHLVGHTVIINKSTMPMGSGDFVAHTLEASAPKGVTYAVVSNPEFLREGAAVRDVMEPDRVVLGGTDAHAINAVAGLYAAMDVPIVRTDLQTAELIKYASNAMLATRVSFINEIAAICDVFGADVRVVAEGMGYDPRIGPLFLEAGIGFGGSCFPKDVKALAHMAKENNLHPQLLNSVLEINQSQRYRFVAKVEKYVGDLRGKRIAVWGLAFKQDTDDMREAPSIEIIEAMMTRGAQVRAYDPEASDTAKRAIRDLVTVSDPYEAVQGADALLLLTPWNEFKQADMARVIEYMRTPVLLDGRNLYDRKQMQGLGFTYCGVGR